MQILFTLYPVDASVGVMLPKDAFPALPHAHEAHRPRSVSLARNHLDSVTCMNQQLICLFSFYQLCYDTVKNPCAEIHHAFPASVSGRNQAISCIRMDSLFLNVHCATAERHDEGAEKIGVAPFTAHQLRHSYATFAANRSAVASKALQGMLGHANFATTMNIYAGLDNVKIRQSSADWVLLTLKFAKKVAEKPLFRRNNKKSPVPKNRG